MRKLCNLLNHLPYPQYAGVDMHLVQYTGSLFANNQYSLFCALNKRLVMLIKTSRLSCNTGLASLERLVNNRHSVERGDTPPPPRPFIFHPPLLGIPPPSTETCIPPFWTLTGSGQTVLKREKGFLAISTQNKTLIIKNDIILSI